MSNLVIPFLFSLQLLCNGWLLLRVIVSIVVEHDEEISTFCFHKISTHRFRHGIIKSIFVIFSNFTLKVGCPPVPATFTSPACPILSALLHALNAHRTFSFHHTVSLAHSDRLLSTIWLHPLPSKTIGQGILKKKRIEPKKLSSFEENDTKSFTEHYTSFRVKDMKYVDGTNSNEGHRK